MAAGEEKLKLVLAAIDRTSAPIRRVNRRIEAMTKPIRKVRNAFRNLAREARLDRLGRAFSGGLRVARRFALGATAALGAVGVAVQKVSARGDEIAKLTRQIGFGSDAFQELEFAAGRAGVEASTFRSSISALSKRVGELQAGRGQLSTFLGESELGKQLKAAKDTEEAFKLVTDAIARVEDPTKKAALASAAFSRAGLPIIRLANEGSEGIAKLREEARRFGDILSDQALADSERFQDSLTNLKASVGGVVAQVTSGLLPVVKDIADRITEWAVANRELIQVRAAEAISNLVRVGGDVIAWLKTAIPATLAFIDRIGGLRTVAIAIGAVFALTLLPAIVGIIGAIVTIGSVIATVVGGIVAVIGLPGLAAAALAAAFVAAGVIIEKNWEGIRDTISGVIDSIIARVTSLIPSLPGPVRRFLGLGDGAPINVASSSTENVVVEQAAAASAGAAAARSDVRLGVSVEDRRVRVEAQSQGAGTVIDEVDLARGTALAPA